MSLYQLNAIACLVLCFLASYAIFVDRRNIRRAWKPFLYFVIAEQGILAYGSLEALDSQVPIEIRQRLFAIILLLMIGAIVLVLITLLRPQSWWYYRDKELSPRHYRPETKDHRASGRVILRSARPAGRGLDAA